MPPINPKDHYYWGKYEYLDKDEQGKPIPAAGNLSVFKVVRPHFTTMMLSQLSVPYDTIADLENQRMDDGDYLLVTPPKTGTHWVFEIMSMIISGSAEYTKAWKGDCWIEITGFKAACAKQTTPRIINTHIPLSGIPKSFRSGQKVVFTLRNMKDAVTAFYHHQQRISQPFAWDDLFNFQMHSKHVGFGNYFDVYADAWDNFRNDPEVFFLYYEDLKKKPVQTIKSLADFMGRPQPDQLIQDIADAVHFSKMKGAKHDSEAVLRQMFGENMTIYRKGEIGDWKTLFTVAQNEEFDRIYKEWNKDRQMPFQFE